MAFFIARLCTFPLHNCVLLFCTIHTKVIDDGSTDNTGEIIDHIAEKA